MSQLIDMTNWIMAEHGVPDSKITVLKRVENNKHGSTRWLCECSCSEHNKFIAIGQDMRSGKVRSCGCLQKEATKKMGQSRPTENKRDLSGKFRILWTTNTNDEVYFDLEDSEEILKHSWYLSVKGYPTSQINGKPVRLHQFIGCYNHDHKNRNKLDNRKSNLRPCTQQENTRNRSKNKNNKSGFTGVYWDKQYCKWVAQIKVKQKTIKLGTFDDKIEALIARLKAEKEIYKEFAPQRDLFDEYNI